MEQPWDLSDLKLYFGGERGSMETRMNLKSTSPFASVK
jgi:hypothetical protein